MHRICRSHLGRRFGLGSLLAALILGGLAPPLLAVDAPSSLTAPDLAAVRAKIKAKDWPAAIGDLNAMIDQGVQQADVYSLLGFSLRKSGDYEKAYTFYRKALEFEPNHKGALEYLGELYVERGEMAKAREHVSLLTRLCPAGCEELDDLQGAIAQAEGGRARNGCPAALLGSFRDAAPQQRVCYSRMPRRANKAGRRSQMIGASIRRRGSPLWGCPNCHPTVGLATPGTARLGPAVGAARFGVGRAAQREGLESDDISRGAGLR